MKNVWEFKVTPKSVGGGITQCSIYHVEESDEKTALNMLKDHIKDSESTIKSTGYKENKNSSNSNFNKIYLIENYKPAK